MPWISFALSDLIGGGESDAVDLLRQGVRIFLHCLNGKIPVGLEDSYRSPGTDTVAVKEEHDLADLHAFLPGIGDPLSALWANSIDGFEAGGTIGDHSQNFGTEVAHQLLRQDRTHSLDEASAEIPLHTLAGRRWGRLQGLGFELEAVFFVPDPTPLAGQPLSGADGRHGAKDGHLVTMPANFHPEHGITALFVEIGNALDKSRNFLERCTASRQRGAHSVWSLSGLSYRLWANFRQREGFATICRPPQTTQPADLQWYSEEQAHKMCVLM